MFHRCHIASIMKAVSKLHAKNGGLATRAGQTRPETWAGPNPYIVG
jgi:hypothetical protein